MRTPHGDNHDMWIHPDQSDLFIQSNDGGANVTTRRRPLLVHATATSRPPSCTRSPSTTAFPYWLYAGQQDNSTIRVPSSTRPARLPRRPRRPSGSPSAAARPVRRSRSPAIPTSSTPTCKGRFGVYNHAHRPGEAVLRRDAANMYGHNPQATWCYRFQRVVTDPRCRRTTPTRDLPLLAVRAPHDATAASNVGDDLAGPDRVRTGQAGHLGRSRSPATSRARSSTRTLYALARVDRRRRA